MSRFLRSTPFARGSIEEPRALLWMTMNSLNERLIDAMRHEVSAYRSSRQDLMELANRLLAIRDLLEFTDREWKDELTDHISTLDSASTFVAPSSAAEQQARSVVIGAVDDIQRLIDTKAVELREE